MRRQSPLVRSARGIGLGMRTVRPSYVCWQCRSIQISASPATELPRVGGDAFGALIEDSRDSADARFEVLGSPYSLLTVTLSASQKLYTRRGTLVSVAGKVENAQSTLSILSPLRRAFLGMPFLYQRVSSTTPITALIATKSPTTTFSVLHLDGTTDWMVAQRNALLAWTGHTLSLSPRVQRGLSMAHWGSTHLTGRGLAALSAPGQTYQVTLGEGEELVLHPSHVVAYSINRNPPQPFRLKSNTLRLQVPSVPASVRSAAERLVPEGLSRFWRAMRDTDTYKFLARLLFGLRTTARRSVWGDRLFLQFKGPTTIVMSSRGVRVRDVLTRNDVNEIADTEAGVVPAAVELATTPKKLLEPQKSDQPVAIHVAAVGKDGKVRFEDTKDLKEFVR
ncbi:mitochondrial biogenesis AIM24-domain-containing protein [Phialemonium atrogriseum]|uniref:Altered inheritance of mitochondria protein 24, mitochondrial n=1 Tax=Phialemonium atrogriseum TaxID=1093897 RepID=A0AAJ0FNP0_9PEZI|nr:mitochondrial biogenesis AIM24-domain-containing protein [Phialemonium atrogriseum]KAK1767355.1 mitochondrial biogenesis AIM24-domain-containing protein [Phialemonium atrogriseum]